MKNGFLMSLGAGLAAGRAAQVLNHLTADDVLCAVGLQRRHNTTLENAGLIGLGIILGAGTALLLAPTDGEQARRNVADGLGKAREASMRFVNDAKARAPEIIESAKHRLREVEDSATQAHHS